MNSWQLDRSDAEVDAALTDDVTAKAKASSKRSMTEAPMDELFTTLTTPASTPQVMEPVSASTVYPNMLLEKEHITVPEQKEVVNDSVPAADEVFNEATQSEEFSLDDADIQQDAAERNVSCIVHAALFFFVALAGIAAFLAIILVSQYGFFAIVVISLLLAIVVGIVMFVDKVMREDAKWKPVRNQIRRWKAVATAVVLKEIRDFQSDWNEHLLLTDGRAEYDLYDDDDDDVPNMDLNSATAAASSTKPKKNRGRSVIFKVIKPFLKVGGRRRRKRKEKEAAAAADSSTGQVDPADSYIPPVV